MPELNTNLDDLSDVTDEAIEAALRITNNSAWSAAGIRNNPRGWRSLILLARCIQSHYPDMIVDPVTRKAREVAASVRRERDCGTSTIADKIERGELDDHMLVVAVKRALAGMEMERGK